MVDQSAQRPLFRRIQSRQRSRFQRPMELDTACLCEIAARLDADDAVALACALGSRWRWNAVMSQVTEARVSGSRLTGIGVLANLKRLEVDGIPPGSADGADWQLQQLQQLQHVRGTLQHLCFHGASALPRTSLTFLAGFSRLEVLCMAGANLGDSCAVRLCSLTSLTCLDISFNGITERGAASIAKSLRALRRINIASNVIGAGGVATLAALPCLTELNASDNRVNGVACPVSTSLRHLRLSYNFTLGYENLLQVECLARLRSLCVRRSGISDLHSICALQCLEHLDVSRNQVGPGGSDHLTALTALTRLDISWNIMQAEGARLLAHALPCLAQLMMCHNDIGDEGAAHLAASLRRLRYLDVRGNDISAGGKQLLARLPPPVVVCV